MCAQPCTGLKRVISYLYQPEASPTLLDAYIFRTDLGSDEKPTGLSSSLPFSGHHMSKFCSRASISRGNPLPPSTWPLACFTDFSTALAELKQRSAHRHAYVPTTHIVTWTQSNKLGSTTSLNFHCRVTSVHTKSLLTTHFNQLQLFYTKLHFT